MLEALYRLQWTSTDGLGVLIISPTRELAYQTFEVLRKVGKNHDFSAGLIIGGKVCLFTVVLPPLPLYSVLKHHGNCWGLGKTGEDLIYKQTDLLGRASWG